MGKRVFSRVRSPRRRSSEFSSFSDGGMFESRPFVVQSKVGEKGEKSGLKASLLQAERYGHHLRQINSASIETSKPLQRTIEGYKSENLRKDAVVFNGLNKAQRDQIEKLHKDKNNVYTRDDARKQVGAEPLNSEKNANMPPFPWRYGDENTGKSHMNTVSSGEGGLVQYPQTERPKMIQNDQKQISVASDSQYKDLPTTSKRNISQIDVMDKVSPNQAAKELGLEYPGEKSWEWLHLVAFSISPTHIDGPSIDSLKLIEKTDQPQQIKENLVLGTAAANTAMLSYETQIKQLMKNNPTWKLNLYTNANKDIKTVKSKNGKEIKIPVATSIDYHFYFEIPTNSEKNNKDQYVGPVILKFDTLSHNKPNKSDYAEVVKALQALQPVDVANRLKGINTNELEQVKKDQLPTKIQNIGKESKK